jgi:hypothetical protein
LMVQSDPLIGHFAFDSSTRFPYAPSSNYRVKQ